jgi:2Fe-2S ferredoxin
MTVIKVKPHKELCPDGAVLEAKPGQTVAEVLLENDVKIEHACELSCACTTCHVIVKKGFNSLDFASEEEEDMLDKAWGLEAESRLSCQAVVESDELEIELPKYTINMVSEEH